MWSIQSKAFLLAAVSLLACQCGCVSTGSRFTESRDIPGWWRNQRPTNEPGQPYLYFYAKGESTRTEQDARDQARASIRQQVAEYILSRFMIEGSDGERRTSFGPQIDVKQVEISGDTAIKSAGRWTAYMCGRYPRSEYDTVVGLLDLGMSLDNTYRSAKSHYHQGLYQVVIRALESDVARHADTPFVEHDIEAAKILLGDAWLASKVPLSAAKARQCYEDVLSTSFSAAWKSTAEERIKKLPDPPRLWMVRNRFGGRSTGLVCLQNAGKGWKPYQDLSMTLDQDCREVLLPTEPLTGLISNADASAVFAGNVQSLVRAGHQRRAEVVLALLVSTDPAKRGQRTVAYGVERDAIDSTIRFFVVRVSDGKPVYSGEFKGVAGQAGDGRLAQYAATILIRNYLDKQCPAVFE